MEVEVSFGEPHILRGLTITLKDGAAELDVGSVGKGLVAPFGA